MSKPRVIKKYPNRRLYDTEESRYVALEELAGWIRRGQQIKVIDESDRIIGKHQFIGIVRDKAGCFG